MALSEAALRLSPEQRTTAFYFTYFMGPGAAVMFLPIWLTEKGITPEEIGIINAVPVFVVLALNLLVGRLADRAGDWRQVILVGAVLGGTIPIGLFFVNGFWGILLLWTLATVPIGAISPVIDAATMRLTRRNGTDFGTIRAWGTVGYMLFNALTGFLVVWFGSAIFVPLFVGLTLLRAAMALLLPRFRAPVTQPTVASVRPVAGKLREIMKPWFLLPLVGFAMIFGTHIILNAFSSLIWKEQGISEDVIGPLIALGAFSEAAMMFVWKRFGGRYSARHLILVSAVASVLRWVAMAFSPPVGVLVLLQLTHGVTYALGFLGCVHFITNWTSEDIAAETQSFFTVLQQAMSVVALIGFGWLVALMSAHAFFIAALFAAIGALCVWLSLSMMQPKDDAAR
jgi:MFS transporter, PPP family, 3-phenylpropionic acid transporter